ncbi:hypothetical protein ACFX2H_022897 [Malus domestica]
MVVGVDWLETLGFIGWNFLLKVMEFSIHGTNYWLVGTSTLLALASPVSEASAFRALPHLSSLTTPDQPPSSTLEHIQALLNQYPELFQPPSSLPPHRAVDHLIPLLPST